MGGLKQACVWPVCLLELLYQHCGMDSGQHRWSVGHEEREGLEGEKKRVCLPAVLCVRMRGPS